MPQIVTPIAATFLMLLGTSAVAASRPSSLDSIEQLPDGSIQVAVTSWLIRPDGSHRPSVNMREKLEEAASYACKGGPYELQTENRAELLNPKSGGLKAKLSGVVICGSAPNNSFKPKPLRGSA
ncbi:hypothetical protein GCM10027430_29350 [Lysobacter tyrosinilyticus]